MDRERRERAILREYESELVSLQEEARELQTMISFLRKRIGVPADVPAEKRLRPDQDTDTDAPTSPRTIYAGKPNIPTVLKEILADGAVHSTDEIYQLVGEHPVFRDKPPSRGSVQNRLGDLVYAKEIERPETGSYRLPQHASANGDVRTHDDDFRLRSAFAGTHGGNQK
jgi:hypothetical protein